MAPKLVTTWKNQAISKENLQFYQYSAMLISYTTMTIYDVSNKSIKDQFVSFTPFSDILKCDNGFVICS